MADGVHSSDWQSTLCLCTSPIGIQDSKFCCSGFFLPSLFITVLLYFVVLFFFLYFLYFGGLSLRFNFSSDLIMCLVHGFSMYLNKKFVLVSRHR